MINSPKTAVHRYNVALDHPTVRFALRHLIRLGIGLDVRAFLANLSELEEFPAISVRALISAAESAGVGLKGGHADFHELAAIPTPFLTYLRRGPSLDSSLDLIQIEKLGRTRAVISRDEFGADHIPIHVLRERWSGVVLWVDAVQRTPGLIADLEGYRREVRVHPAFLNPNQCSELIDYCERNKFARSRVSQVIGNDVRDVIEARARSSASVALERRDHPTLRLLYEKCASLEGVGVEDIENIQCVRYRNHQRFRLHFDAAVHLPRRTTYLLYLNDGFDGGETYFSMLNQTVRPRVGSCLKFPSSDLEGRVNWQSEHGGLPVRAGVKYALNIWVRYPARTEDAGQSTA